MVIVVVIGGRAYCIWHCILKALGLLFFLFLFSSNGWFSNVLVPSTWGEEKGGERF